MTVRHEAPFQVYVGLAQCRRSSRRTAFREGAGAKPKKRASHTRAIQRLLVVASGYVPSP